MGNYLNRLCGNKYAHSELEFYNIAPVESRQVFRQNVLFEGWLRVEKQHKFQGESRSHQVLMTGS